MKTKLSGFLALFIVLIVQFSFAQEKTITGIVTDSDGLPLPGATVQVKGTSNGTQTDFDGNYTITTLDGDILVFSYIGMESTEKKVTATTSTFDVSLSMSSTQLDEVVITALGIKRKQDELTTANQVVKAEQITQASSPDAVTALTGKVSGLTINTTSSGVNETNRVILRGNRSITGNNEALVVVDGVISSINFMKSIDPNNIASVNVIKGANGAALYGSQGSNGVIVVTTKKGSGTESKMTVDIRTTVDMQSIQFLPERQTRYGQGWSSSNGYANYTYENGGWGPEFDGQMTTIGLPQADGTYVTRPYSSLGSDNIKEFFQTGMINQNQFSISSGDEEGYINLTAQNQSREFIIEDDKLKQNSFQFKAGKTLGKWSISGNAFYNTRHINTADPDAGLYGDLLQAATNIPIKAFKNSGNEGHWNGYYFNPYWIVDNNRYEARIERTNFIGELQYSFNDHINALVRSNAYLTSSESLTHQSAYTDPDSVVDISGYTRSQNSSFYRTSYLSRNYYTDFIVNFDYKLTEDLSLKANIGANNQYELVYETRTGGENLTVPGLYTIANLSNGIDTDESYDDQALMRRYAVYGQLDLGYKDFLFLNATARNDWSSLLNQENNSYFYPSVGVSFIPTKAVEGLKNNNVLNYLKLLASYVQVGNDGGIDPYQINATVVTANGFPYDSNSYVLNTEVTDPNLKPEFTTSYEFGLNAGLFQDAITLDATYYLTNTTDLITGVTPSYTSGLTSATVNIAETELKGFEVDLGIHPFRSTNFDWTMNLSYSTNTTEVLAVTDQSDEVYLGGYSSGAGIYAVKGEEYPMLKGTSYERDDQGRIIVDPTTGNPVIASELKNFGRTTPKHIVGLNTSVTWKNFTLSTTLDYRTGHVFYSRTKYSMTWPGHIVESAYNRGAFVVPNSSYYNEATESYVANTNITAGNTASAFTQYYSTYVADVDENNILDATAIKIRELSLKYNFPSKFLESTPIQSLTISANARNLYTWLPKENRGYADPEANFTSGNAQGISTNTNYPTTRTFGVGLNVIF